MNEKEETILIVKKTKTKQNIINTQRENVTAIRERHVVRQRP